MRYIADFLPGNRGEDRRLKRSLRYFHEFLRFRIHLSDPDRHRAIGYEPVMNEPEVKGDDIPFLENLRRFVRNTVHHLVVYGNTERRRVRTGAPLGRIALE